MEIPKKIDALLVRRRKLAEQLDGVSYQVDRWLLKNGVEPDSACWMTGSELYVNPAAAEEEVRRAILETGHQKREY